MGETQVADAGSLSLSPLMKPAPLNTLTSLRFFAASSIVLFHMQAPILGVPSYGPLALGVSFFFVLSGFILTYSYQGGVNLRRFYVARFARLWPAHAVTMILTLWAVLPALTSRPEWFWPGVANLLLVHAWIPVVGYVFSFNGVSWSISAELFFYLLFPALRGKWGASLICAILVMTAASLATLDLLKVPIGGRALWEFSTTHYVLQHPSMRILEFVAGVVTGKLFLGRKCNCGTALEIGALAGVALFVVCSNPTKSLLSGLGWHHSGLWISQSGGILIFAAAIYIFAHEGGALSRALRNRFLVLLGEVSFATYLIHQIVIKYASQHKWVDAIGEVPATTAIVALVYAGSFLLWTFVEKPGRRLLLATDDATRLFSLRRAGAPTWADRA